MKNTKQVKVGACLIGGGAPVIIQSMTTTKTADLEKTVAQISALEKAGCEMYRMPIGRSMS